MVFYFALAYFFVLSSLAQNKSKTVPLDKFVSLVFRHSGVPLPLESIEIYQDMNYDVVSINDAFRQYFFWSSAQFGAPVTWTKIPMISYRQCTWDKISVR
jgi:hypothetical protein